MACQHVDIDIAAALQHVQAPLITCIAICSASDSPCASALVFLLIFGAPCTPSPLSGLQLDLARRIAQHESRHSGSSQRSPDLSQLSMRAE